MSCAIITFVAVPGVATFQTNTFSNCDGKIIDGNSANDDDLWVIGM